MNWILRILFFPLLVVNFVVALLLIGCAYSPLLPPATFPLLSLAGLAFPIVLAINILFIVGWLVVCRRYIWLSAIACLICLPQIRAFAPINFDQQETPSDAIKLLSYNILSSNLTPSTANSDNPLIAYLEESDADIICLQEFPFASLKSNAKAKKLLSDYPYKSYNVSKDSETTAKFLGCLSKFPILSVEKLDIGSTTNGCTKYRMAALFRGDNGENPHVRGEFLWSVSYSAEKTQSYGGTSYILSASLASTDITDQSRPNGQRNGWAGLRVPYEYVSRYFGVSDPDYVTGSYDVADKRGEVFYIKGRSESMEGALYSFMNGWSCLKFNNIPSGQTDQSFLPVSAVKAFSDIDFPMIRLAEIYLIYAEACMNLGEPQTALPYLALLSSRAGVAPP